MERVVERVGDGVDDDGDREEEVVAGWIFTEAAGELLRRERAEDAAFWAALRRPAPLVTVTAVMQDGTMLVEEAADFNAYLDLVLPLRRDPECVRVEWREAATASAA